DARPLSDGGRARGRLDARDARAAARHGAAIRRREVNYTLMRLCRFGDGALGLVDGDAVRDVSAALDALPAYRYPLPEHDVVIASLDAVRARIAQLPSSLPVPLASVRLLSPVANPGKIVCAPVNYQKHLDEVRDQAQLNQGNQG